MELGDSGDEATATIAAGAETAWMPRGRRGFLTAGGELGGELLLLSELLAMDEDEPLAIPGADAAAASASSSGSSLAWPLMCASISFLFLNVS